MSARGAPPIPGDTSDKPSILPKPVSNSDAAKNFSRALLIGCALIALAVFHAGIQISDALPQVMQGQFHGALTNAAPTAPEEFMSEWEAADFLRMCSVEFGTLLQSGEFSGTYAVFQVERRVPTMHVYRDGEFFEISPRIPPERREAFEEHLYLSGGAEIIPPTAGSAEISDTLTITENHRVFSREKLTQWLNNRIAS